MKLGHCGAVLPGWKQAQRGKGCRGTLGLSVVYSRNTESRRSFRVARIANGLGRNPRATVARGSALPKLATRSKPF